MKKLKIGYVIKYFYPIKGGAENYILNLALNVKNDGHEVHVFTSDRKGKEVIEKKEEVYKGIKIHRFRPRLDLTLYLSFNPSLARTFLKEDLDIVHVSGFGFIWYDLILIIKKLKSRRTKFINTPHGPFMALSSYNFLFKILKVIYTKIQKIFLNWLYDIVLADNTFQWRWIIKDGIDKQKIRLVPPGIRAERIEQKITEEEVSNFIQKYGLKKAFVISNLGRISEYKGIQDVISILPKLVRIRPDIIFLIMGRDEGYVRTLKSQAERKRVLGYVRFITDISEEEKFVALEVSNIFVFPSEWEAFGIAMLEAMTRGNALVSTRTEGGKFLVTEGVNGYLYNFGDTEKLFDLLKSLIENKEKLSHMKEENRKKAREFCWERIYEKQYLPILKSLS